MWWSSLDLHPLSSGHQHALSLHLLTLDANDRATRFGLALKDAAILDWVARIDWREQRWWGAWLPGDLGLGGAVLLAPCETAGCWELALSVDPQLRRGGLGTALVQCALAQAPDVRRVVCYHGHSVMRALARRSGYSVRAYRDSPRLELLLPGHRDERRT